MRRGGGIKDPSHHAPDAAQGSDESAEVQPYFLPLVQRLEELLVHRFHLHEQALPPHLARRRGDPTGRASKAEIRSRVFLSDSSKPSPVRRLRVVLVSNGPQLQAYNAVLFPNYGLGPVPVLGIDILSFNNHKRLIFGADWAPMMKTKEYTEAYITSYLSGLKERHGSLVLEPSAKFYGEDPEFFSPEMFFARPSEPEAVLPGGGLWQVFEEYCMRYGDMLQEAATAADGNAEEATVAQERQCAFDAWHSERDPALPIFRRLFGAEWTEEYMAEVLFPGVTAADQH